MSSEPIYDAIKSTVLSYLPTARILLFGSRARGDHDNLSDYDLMVITPENLTHKEKLSWSRQLNKDIAINIHIPIDLLIYSEEEIVRKQQLPNHIVRTAIREGLTL
jgi:predicted nucleotidyltransferase